MALNRPARQRATSRIAVRPRFNRSQSQSVSAAGTQVVVRVAAMFKDVVRRPDQVTLASRSRRRAVPSPHNHRRPVSSARSSIASTLPTARQYRLSVAGTCTSHWRGSVPIAASASGIATVVLEPESCSSPAVHRTSGGGSRRDRAAGVRIECLPRAVRGRRRPGRAGAEPGVARTCVEPNRDASTARRAPG